MTPLHVILYESASQFNRCGTHENFRKYGLHCATVGIATDVLKSPQP